MSECTLITGGATGSDEYWQTLASEGGIAVRVMSFEEHKPVKVPAARVEVLSTDQLKEADEIVKMANERLNQTFPCKTAYASNLIRRNYHIINNATTVMAIGVIEKDHITGGTAWGVVMADLMGKGAYVFDMRGSKWYKYRAGKFDQCCAPTLRGGGIFAGIGSRQLVINGKRAIAGVLDSINHA